MCEKVEMTMRDGFQVPVVLVYDKRFYTEESPWLLFTRGIDSSKEDLALTPGRLSLTDRGIVCAYPMIRGKSK
jgi:protease II